MFHWLRLFWPTCLMFMSKILFALFMLFIASVSCADIDVVGLFEGKAVVNVDGVPKVVRPGDALSSGVTLIDATAKKATFNVNGKILEVGLGNRVGTAFKHKEQSGLNIYKDQVGMYKTSGLINSQPVDFLVDTGATTIAMSSIEAKRLGVNYLLSNRVYEVSTAMGKTLGYSVMLDKVRVGEIELNNVEAMVLAGDHPDIILLGMSFLGRVEVLHKGGVMQLLKKH